MAEGAMEQLSKEKKKHKRSIVPLSLMLLIAAIAVSVLLGIILLEGPQEGIINTAALIALMIFIIALLLYVWNIALPMISLETKLGLRRTGQGKDATGRTQNDSKLPFFDVFVEIAHIANENKAKTEKEYALTMLKKQTELKTLQSQINPHFLYNTLDCIRGMAIEYGVSDIEEMTKALSGIFRYSISRNNREDVLFEDEIKNTDNYLLIQQYRFRNKINVHKKIEPLARKCYVPKLVLQPLVENAVFHGLEQKVGQRNLYIEAYCTNKRLIIKVEDDGIGIPVNKINMINDQLHGNAHITENNKSTRIGLANVNERVKLQYGAEFGLRIFSCPGIGTTCEVVMPVILGK